MADVNQTNKTILFEEFSDGDDVPRLDFILKSNMNLNIKVIREKLIVKSFDEFMEKFDPKYYEYTSIVDGQEIPTFEYGLTKQLKGGIEHRLVDQPFYKAMMDLYLRKGKSGINNFEFDFNEINEKAFSPKKAMEEVQDIRKKLVYNTNELLKIEARNGSDDEKGDFVEEIDELREKIRVEYFTKNPFNLLPLLIEDTKNRLEVGMTGDSTSEDGNDKCGKQVLITFDGTGKPKYIEQKADLNISSNSNQALLETSANNSTTKLIGWIENDFDEAQKMGKNLLVVDGHEESGNFMKNMLVSVFAGKSLEMPNVTRKELENNLRIYEQMYTSSQKNFAQTVVSLVEKILNVRAFFDNAGGKTELIISNCSIEKLLNNNPNFIKYIESVGNETNDEKIWFAIIPAIDHKKFVRIKGINKDININNNLIGFSTLKFALDLLSKNNIISFFNFKGCEKSSFSGLDVNSIKAYKKEFESVAQSNQGKTGEYSIFCYPNFTVLPDRESSVKIGSEYIKLPSVYIDASYVACGLYVKCQNIDELSKKGLKVNTALGCPVRFDFESCFKINNNDVQLSQIFATNMNRENILSWSPDLVEEISRDGGFGFCFCDDEVIYRSKDNKNIKQQNAYVYKARTLGSYKIIDENDEETGEIHYKPIFRTLVKTYITNVNRLNQGNFKQLDDNCKSWNSLKNKEYINNLLKGDDFIEVKPNPATNKTDIKIKYGIDKNYKEVEIFEM